MMYNLYILFNLVEYKASCHLILSNSWFIWQVKIILALPQADQRIWFEQYARSF